MFTCTVSAKEISFYKVCSEKYCLSVTGFLPLFEEKVKLSVLHNILRVSGRSSQVCGRQHVVWVCRWLHTAFCSNALAGPYFTPKTKEIKKSFTKSKHVFYCNIFMIMNHIFLWIPINILHKNKRNTEIKSHSHDYDVMEIIFWTKYFF